MVFSYYLFSEIVFKLLTMASESGSNSRDNRKDRSVALMINHIDKSGALRMIRKSSES